MACNSQGFWTPWWWLRLSGRNMLEWLNNNKLVNPKLICAFCWFVLFFYNFCLKHYSLQEELSEIWPKICIGLHVYYQLVFMYTTNYSTAILMKLKFSSHILEKYYQISWKSVQWEHSCSMWKDGRTDGQTWRS